MTENELSFIVIREAIDIHNALGPGLLEKVYVECLYYRLIRCGLAVIKEQPVPVIFEEVRMEWLSSRFDCRTKTYCRSKIN